MYTVQEELGIVRYIRNTYDQRAWSMKVRGHCVIPSGRLPTKGRLVATRHEPLRTTIQKGRSTPVPIYENTEGANPALDFSLQTKPFGREGGDRKCER